MKLEEASSPDNLLLECVSGSKAYGTDTPESDEDLRGVFVVPRRVLYGLSTIEQVSDTGNDETYYEVGRFVELLLKNNPNVMELLYMPEDCIRFRNSLMDLLQPELFLSKLCKDTFAGYAMTQVKKARGLNKKIVNPMEVERKSLLEFCFVVEGQGSVPLETWLAKKGIQQSECGLVSIPHMRDVYGVYHDSSQTLGYRGVIRDNEGTELCLSSVPKGEQPVGWMNFNRDGFKRHCKEYKEYWQWVNERNEARYTTNVEHGKNYDSKNLMHTFRLLDTAAEIAREGRIGVRRPNREFLMSVRRGEFDYDDLIRMAEEKIEEIHELFAVSPLPETPDRKKAEEALVEIRERWYGL